MALDDFTINQNTGYVEQATVAMSAGQLADIERRAKASVTTAQVETARATSAEKETGAKAAGGSEAKVYGDIAIDALAPGLKMVSSATDFLSQRHADHEGTKISTEVSRSGSEGIARNAVHIEQDIAGANRSPGVYRIPAEQRAFGANITDAPAKPGVSIRTKATAGEDLMASANIASSSLKDQGKEAIGSWDVKESKMASVQMAKKMTFGQELSNEQALQSVHIARQQHSATMGMVNQMSPGLGLGSGPSIRPQDLLKEARDDADMNRWRTQQS